MTARRAEGKEEKEKDRKGDSDVGEEEEGAASMP